MAARMTQDRAEGDMSDHDQDIFEIREIESARQRALTAPDLDALDWILADDLIHVHSTGMVHDKAQFISHIQRMGGFRSIERGPLDIRVEGNMAIVTGAAANGVRSPETGENIMLNGFSSLVFRKADRGWQVVLSQMTLFRDGRGARRS
jgi:ketosteroid isomerase-like protein